MWMIRSTHLDFVNWSTPRISHAHVYSTWTFRDLEPLSRKHWHFHFERAWWWVIIESYCMLTIQFLTFRNVILWTSAGPYVVAAREVLQETWHDVWCRFHDHGSFSFSAYSVCLQRWSEDGRGTGLRSSFKFRRFEGELNITVLGVLSRVCVSQRMASSSTEPVGRKVCYTANSYTTWSMLLP